MALHPDATIPGVLMAYPYARHVMETTLVLAKEDIDQAADYVSSKVNHMSYDELTAFGLVASASACAILREFGPQETGN